MNEFHYIDFASTPLKGKLRRLLIDLDITSQSADVEEIDGYFGVRLPSNDPRIQKLTAALDELHLDPPYGVRREVEYDRGDLEPCEFVRLAIIRPGKGNTGPLYDTEYDLSTACPECGTGAVQTSPLRINAKDLPKNGHVWETSGIAYLVSNELATDLMIELGGERGLRQVEERRLRDLLPWWQILPDASMPRADPVTGFRAGLEIGEAQCPRCRRDGFYGRADQAPMEYTYRMSKSERRKLPNFVSTWEHFGKSRIKWEPRYTIGFAPTDTLVSNRVMRVFWAKNIKGVEFFPVRFIEP